MIELYDLPEKNHRLSVLTTAELAEVSIDAYIPKESRWVSITKLTCHVDKKQEIVTNILGSYNEEVRDSGKT